MYFSDRSATRKLPHTTFDSFHDELAPKVDKSAKIALSREMSSYEAMAGFSVLSDGGIVFYALEIV